jgi:hypothetical protein
MGDWYEYGSAGETPHVHCYGVDSHLKISDRGSIHRYNIVQNGKVHSQATEALRSAEDAKGSHPTLPGIVAKLIRDAGGEAAEEAVAEEDTSPDDFPSMTALWNHLGKKKKT